MIYFEPKSMDAAYHFAVEEYLMKTLETDEPAVMLWQTQKTVMIGSNQVAASEINENVVRENDIKVVRRRSGGGTIYTDAGTFLYTIILPHRGDEDVKEVIRTQVAAPIVGALKSLGIPAALEGRNDILVDGKKVSGLAQFIANGRLCSHGSLLYEADLDMLTSVLNVDEDKIKSKALRSVRSRVTNLKEYMTNPLSPYEFLEVIKAEIFAGNTVREYTPDPACESAIGKIKKDRFDSYEWTYGKSPEYSFQNSRRYPGGKLELYIGIDAGTIQNCSIRGDFLGLSPIENLEKLFMGVRFEERSIAGILHEHESELPRYIGSISVTEFLDCLFS